MKQLNEKVAVVTGAGQGIGKGIALCLAKRGVKVIATGRHPLRATIAEIRQLGGEGFAMTCDSADRERVFEVVAKAVETYGSIDVIVNNGQVHRPLPARRGHRIRQHAQGLGVRRDELEPYTQAAFPHMKEQHEGRIINFASATGMFGIAGQLADGSNKGRRSDQDRRQGVGPVLGTTVNVVLPGAESPAAKAWAEKFPEEYAKQVNLNPMKRFGDPEMDIALVIAFLAGPDSCDSARVSSWTAPTASCRKGQSQPQRIDMPRRATESTRDSGHLGAVRIVAYGA